MKLTIRPDPRIEKRVRAKETVLNAALMAGHKGPILVTDAPISQLEYEAFKSACARALAYAARETAKG